MGLDFIGDIHGELGALDRLLEKLGYGPGKVPGQDHAQDHAPGQAPDPGSDRSSHQVHPGSEAWQHPEGRRAVFLGDLMDRGPGILGVLERVRAMVESGNAICLLGNHEYNAVCWSLEDPASAGDFLRSHASNHRKQHQHTLEAFATLPDAGAGWLDWFRTLPLAIEGFHADGRPAFRAVHACWDESSRHTLAQLDSTFVKDVPLDLERGSTPWAAASRPAWDASPKLAPPTEPASEAGDPPPTPPDHPVIRSLCIRDDSFFIETTRTGSPGEVALETVLKGREMDCPAGLSFRDKQGHERRRMRVRWWLEPRPGALLAEHAIGTDPEDPRLQVPLSPEAARSFGLPAASPPVFFGHYWMPDPSDRARFGPEPRILSERACCLDWSVAEKGHLAAYRWDGEAFLSDGRLVSVPAVPEP